MKKVILESPYAGNIEENRVYAQRAGRVCAFIGESVLASHLLFPQFLDEEDPTERELGIELGLAWLDVADYQVFFTDRGWSRGMLGALRRNFRPERLYFVVRIRSLDGIPTPPTKEEIALARGDWTGEISWFADMKFGKIVHG